MPPDAPDALTVDEMVLAFRNIRAAKADIENEAKARVAELDEQLATLSAGLIEICQAQGVESMRTGSGTVSLSPPTRYWTSDWGAMYEFVREHDAFNLLQQRLHDGNVKTFLEENPDLHPIGLNADSKYQVTVRKPTGK